jgi:fatty acid desaturase
VDDQEAEHLRSENRELRRSRAWWRAVAALLAGVVVALAVAGGMSTFLLGKTWADRKREEADLRRAQETLAALDRRLSGADDDELHEEMAERLRKARALWEKEARRDRARTQADALAPVAGGIALAALDPAAGDER